MEDEVSAFFKIPSGASVLHRVTVSIIIINVALVGLSELNNLSAMQALANMSLHKGMPRLVAIQ